MRTKVISILAVAALYFFLYFWCWGNVPFVVGEETVSETLAFMGIGVLSTLGLLLSLYHTIKWLIKEASNE